MTFEEILDQAMAMLQRRGRVSYRTLTLQFHLDAESLEALKEELIEVHHLAVDHEGRMLVWTGEAHTPSVPPFPHPPQQATRQADQPPQVASPAAPSSADAERRHLTVMFCDLMDSTRLSGQLDPEDLREVIRTYQSACAEVIQRFDGHIAQYLGDGLLVYFGYPQAHEDDAHRAVRAGLGIIGAMHTLNTHIEQRHGMRIAVRLGIHTGVVVVGEVGSGSRQEQLALGETPNIAARLQGLAAPDTVVISAATSQLVQGYFISESLGDHTLRGVATPVPVYRILGESGVQTRLDAVAPTRLTPLVGREEEVALLQRRWEQAKTGQGQVVLVSGEAGIGKSRLVQVLKDHVAYEPHARVEWRGSAYHQQSALHPIIDHLHRLLRWHPDDSPAEKLHTLEATLALSGLALSEAVPLLAVLLSFPLPASCPPLILTPQRQRQQTLEILLAWLHAEARRRPVLVLVEDLHWIDPSTLELLSLLIEQAAQAPLYLVLIARPEFHPPWAMAAHLTALTLRRFTPDQIERIATHVAGDKALPPAVLQEVVRKTDGVPLFVEELTKTVLESGLLREQADRYELPGPLPPLAIPATLHDALMARLDRLATVKAVAQLGATIGRTLAYDLLQAVAPLEAATLQDALAQLVEAEIVAQRGLPPQATYTFKHALIQDAAYQSLLKSTRQQYHQHIAQVLETHFPETVETQPELLAHHALRGEVWGKAMAHFRQAGARAYNRAAFHEAVAAFEQALQALAHLPEHGDTQVLALELRFALTGPLNALGAYGRCLALLGEAEALARALNDRARLGRVLVRMANALRETGDLDGAIAASQQALALAAELSDSALQVRASYSLGTAYRAIGDFGRSAELLRQNVEAADRESGTPSTEWRIRSRAGLALTLSALGAFAEGRRHGEEALRLAALEGRGATPLAAHTNVGYLYLTQGDLEHAVRVLEQGLALCRASDNRDWLRWIVAGLGYAYALQGRLAEGHTLLEEAISESIRTGARQGWYAYTRLSEVCRLAGRGEEAWQHARQALDLTRQLKERGNEALALHQLGAVHAHADPPDVAQAEDCYRQALTLADELGMRPLQAHCHLGLGTLYAKIGQREQARAELSTAIALYRAMEMTFWLPQAEAMLTQVEGR
jgi:class 3 adenylate cyclase/tetratricopeptide (TPR) repeat protein